jgi:hypothetical protein
LGGALKAIGLTGVNGTGSKLAASADTAIAEASLLPAAERMARTTSALENLWGGAKVNIGKGLMQSDRAIVATFGTFGEAGMEALGNSQQFRAEKIADFTENMVMSDGMELEEINRAAAD